MVKTKSPKKSPAKHKTSKKLDSKKFPTLKLKTERDIAMDFGEKVYGKFNKMVKSVVLFGSTTKGTRVPGSDIDIILIIDDVAVKFDQELVAWYREELGKIIAANPYKKELHINTVKLSTWWTDLYRGDPVVINIIRYGEAMFDMGGFFNPLKVLLETGKIKPSPEAIYTALQRAPQHLARSKQAEISSIEGVYWAFVDSAHAALIAAKVMPPSPEHVPILLRKNFVDKRMLKNRYIAWYQDLYELHRRIVHGQISDIKGQDIDMWQDRADEFIRTMASIINKIVR